MLYEVMRHHRVVVHPIENDTTGVEAADGHGLGGVVGVVGHDQKRARGGVLVA